MNLCWLGARLIQISNEDDAAMRITPKISLIATAILMTFGLLWLGFAEGRMGQATASQGIGVAGQYPNQFIGAETMTAAAPAWVSGNVASSQVSKGPGAKPKDNVPALALSGSVIASMVMLALAFARIQADPSGISIFRRKDPVTIPVSNPAPQL